MLNGKFRGKDIGSGTATWQLSEGMKAGTVSREDLIEAEICMSRSAGHCMTMGTASTMATMVEALGLTLPGASAIPAVDSRKKVMAHLSGNRIVEMVNENLKMSDILTRKAFENAIRINSAVGGSTNFVIHLIALAGRLGVEVNLDDFDRLGSDMPLLLNLMPSGKYLMEDFYYAGGLPVIIDQLSKIIHSDALTVNGKTIGENCKGAACYNHDVIAPLNKPLKEKAGIAVLKGNLCENGAVIKPSATSGKLLQHRGRAVVFENIEDYHTRIDNPDLDIDENCIMVLKGAGPAGYPGMPEVGNLELPEKLIRKGITDMVRISDARMSGTAYGTVVIHISPESSVGGTLALVKSGDMIDLNVEKRSLTLLVPEEELQKRRSVWTAPEPSAERGYVSMFIKHVEQADKGCDFDFLKGGSGSVVLRDLH
jgi:dihydroxy-acid dehydratase